MNADKIRQYIGFIGGALGGILLFLQALGIDRAHFNNESINAFTEMLLTFAPSILIGYGVWMNQYILTAKAKQQEQELKRKGMN